MPFPTPQGSPLWSVSGLTQAIKNELEGSFPSLQLEGEISNYRPSSAGHLYFSLKDSKALISAVIFRNRSNRLSLTPKDGLQVIVEGKIDIYPPRGSYQIIVESLRAAGKGALLEALERRKEALAKESLFNQDRKKSLPPYPRRVAVISSPTGAALRDVLQVLARREAAPRVTILPCPVQGEGAAERIAAQIKRAGTYQLGDVVIVTRGGGSLEDLMPFNEEVVVRAIAACPLPLICGVGHEIDVTLADLAADVRAPTPSAAAELVSDRCEDLLIRSRGFRREASGLIRGRLESSKHMVKRFSPQEFVRLVRGRLELSMRRVDDGRSELIQASKDRLEKLGRRLELAQYALRDGSPKNLMARGYARVSRQGKTVVDANILKKGDALALEFAKGSASVSVCSVEGK